MQTPVQITIRDAIPTESIISRIEKRANKLETIFNRINSCRVVVSGAQKQKLQGKEYNVSIDLTVPGKEIVVNRNRDENLYKAIRIAFDALSRKLEGYARKRHGLVKKHNKVIYGTITRVFAEGEYGFIETTDGREYYFNFSNIISADIGNFRVGGEVQFTESVAGDGLQANHIIVK